MVSAREAVTHAALGRFKLAGDAVRDDPQALAAWWRGAVAARFPADTAFHGHEGERTALRYPEVQYRWVEGAPALFVTGEATHTAMTHPWPGVTVRLGEHERRVTQVDWTVTTLTREFSRRLVRYEFGAPWLALNQENHAKYRAFSANERRRELDRILVGNLLTMSQGFGWFYGEGETVYAAFECEREVPCRLKDVSLMGFTGAFVTNLALPDHLALGRSVSHGFGWFRRG